MCSCCSRAFSNKTHIFQSSSNCFKIFTWNETWGHSLTTLPSSVHSWNGTETNYFNTIHPAAYRCGLEREIAMVISDCWEKEAKRDLAVLKKLCPQNLRMNKGTIKTNSCQEWYSKMLGYPNAKPESMTTFISYTANQVGEERMSVRVSVWTNFPPCPSSSYLCTDRQNVIALSTLCRNALIY